MENKVANMTRSLGYSKIVINSDQTPSIGRSMERNVIASLFEDDFRELFGCQVVMQHSPVEESAAVGMHCSVSHTLFTQDAGTSLVKSRPSHIKEYKIGIMAEMEKDENKRSKVIRSTKHRRKKC